MTACGSSRTVTASKGRKVTNTKGSGSLSKIDYAIIDGSMDSSSRALLTEAKKWLGTPYKYGGEDKNGVDCSGFVMNVYRNALNIKLPRSSSKQMEYSSSISKRDLIPGDLLFFTTIGGNYVSHVGLYIGEGKMIHSSTSRGVMVSKVDEDYFVKTFAAAGRVDAYYAMLSRSGKNKSSKPKATESSAEPSFRYEPVAEVPKRKTPEPSKPTAATAAKPQPIQIQTPAISSGAKTPDISADEARRQVLNSLIEQKLDSIYTSTAQ
ncbi:MAG: C40 family peptidase [Duncaniella sp.]|nr:C40 family peptidase [Duncaniella sp.]